MRYRLLAIAILFPLAIHAQAPQRIPTKALVSGTVIDAGNNQPLRKATVTLTATGSEDQASGSFTATTGPDGTFSIADIEPGRYSLSVERSGYLLDRKARKLRFLTLEAGQTIRDLQIPLVACGVVTGRVLDTDGDPLPQATVQIIKKGRRSTGFGYVEPAQTNDMGEYRIFQVAPGNYYVMASLEREAMSGLAVGIVMGKGVSSYKGAKADPMTGYVPLY